jgi:hypothetical protein
MVRVGIMVRIPLLSLLVMVYRLLRRRVQSLVRRVVLSGGLLPRVLVPQLPYLLYRNTENDRIEPLHRSHARIRPRDDGLHADRDRLDPCWPDGGDPVTVRLPESSTLIHPGPIGHHIHGQFDGEAPWALKHDA